MRSVGAVILAGGKSLRMGSDKARLQLEGSSFLERVAGELRGFDEVLLSVDRSDRYTNSDLQVVEDQFPGCGPISGLYSALKACRSDWLLAVSCDIPMFTRDLAEYMVSYLSGEYDAVVAVTRDGTIHPLCAIYSRPVADILEEQIRLGDYRMTHALEKIKMKEAPLRHSAYPDEILQNINTPEQFRMLHRRIHGAPIIAVSGVKNSGKTTLLTGILLLLKKQGIHVAVMKHDGHDFIPDVPETDSYRVRQAGAYGVAIYSDVRYMITAEKANTNPIELARQFSEADLILLEGGKNTAYPKLEVVRAAVSKTFACAQDSLIGLCTDTEPHFPGHTFSIDDYDGITDLLLEYLRKELLL